MGYVGTKPADAALTSADIADGVVTADKLATDAVETAKVKDANVTNAKLGTDISAAKLTAGTVATARLGSGTASSTTILYGDQTYKTEPAEYDDDVIQSNIAMLGFKVAVNGSLSRYNLVDQSIDEYFDATGVDSGASTGANRNAAGKYYSGTGVDPTGGTITTHGSYTVHTFLLADTGTDFTPGVSGNVSALVVAGGGGAGFSYAGGGGAGGFRTDATHAVTAQAYTITVGDGGAGKTSTGGGVSYGANGGDSVFNTITSTGGGGGGGALIDVPSATGRDGGSGGGSGLSGVVTDAGDGNTPSTSPSQGNDGSLGHDAGTVGGNSGGAGGGATSAGTAGSSGQGGNGGAGTSNDYRTGSGVVYAGGGAGGSGTTGGTGGTGGGGNGSTSNGSAATDHTGGGGGAGSNTGGTGGDGGSGIVVIRYTTADFVGVVNDMTLQSTDVTAEAEPSYGELITLIENAAGTATLNTDIKGYVSCDSGVTFAQGTLVDEGTWGTNKQILAFHDLDISSQTGTSMCYKITTHNQSVSKDTRVYATSIGWR